MVSTQRFDREPATTPRGPSLVVTSGVGAVRLSKKPITVRELRDALSKLPDSQKIEIYEGDEINKISLATIKAHRRSVIVLH